MPTFHLISLSFTLSNILMGFSWKDYSIRPSQVFESLTTFTIYLDKLPEQMTSFRISMTYGIGGNVHSQRRGHTHDARQCEIFWYPLIILRRIVSYVAVKQLAGPVYRFLRYTWRWLSPIAFWLSSLQPPAVHWAWALSDGLAGFFNFFN